MKIAGVQMDVTIGDAAGNLRRIVERLRETRAAGAELAIFPECAVSGYCFGSLEEARELAQSIPGPATEQVAATCRELGMHAVFGMLEAAGEGVFNAAVLVGPAGLVGSYRKVHLPFLGADMFATHGDRPFAVHDVGPVRVGMSICYDSSFPESSRCLALAGADLIALPTNWPGGAECVAEHVINTRAMENAVYFAAVNRIGEESGFRFIGRSRICAPDGSTLAAAGDTEETILYAEIDPQRARNKTAVREPGRHAIDRMADRRPAMYAALTQPHDLTPPGRTRKP
jgi:predicted amidohydrolase